MKKFIIGTTDFGIGEMEFKIDKPKSILVNLTIRGNQEMYDKITKDEDGEWSWTLYPPKIYLGDVPFTENGNAMEIVVNEDILNQYDVALYLMEHNDFFGKVSIENNVLRITGTVSISGEEMPLEIETKIA
jgi:hypothetical protein